jgi:hypothetical protein
VWCARARTQWPLRGQTSLSPRALAFHACAGGFAQAHGEALTQPSADDGACSGAALLYTHDGRYTKALASAFAHMFARGVEAMATPARGACSALSWREGALEARRDTFGFSPLWYTLSPGGASEGVAVASHPWLLRALRDDPCEVHLGALAAFLSGDDADDPEDFFAGLYRLRPGEGLRWREGALTLRRRPLGVAQSRDAAAQPWADALLGALARERVDVEPPAAVALSGGIDSGLVVAACLRAHPDQRLRAVSLTSARWADMDESPAIDQWEAEAPIDIARCCTDGFGPLTAAPLLRAHADLGPQAHGGVAFLAGLARFARAGGDELLLTGLGGDQAMDLPDEEWLTSALWRGDAGALSQRWRGGGVWPFYAAWARPHLTGAWLQSLRRALGGRYLVRSAQHLAQSPWRDARHWLTADALDLSRLRHPTPDQRMTWSQGWIWEDSIRHLTLCQLASGVRFAHPLLDAPVVDLLCRAPSALLMHPQPKALARIASRGIMPEAVRALPKVGGFDSLMEQGIADHADTTLAALFTTPRLRALGLLQTDLFLNVLHQFVRWTHLRGARRVGYAHLWRTIAAELWLQALTPLRDPPWSHDE